jgi:group I intron endonuclease
MIIYKATNKITNKIYIGQTINSLEKRIKSHIKESKLENNRPFLLSLAKYGIDNFFFEVIDEANSLDELNEKEIYWISEFNSISPNGYNITFGGQGKKLKPSDEFKKLVSEGLKKSAKWQQTKNSENYKNKLKNNFLYYNLGKKFSDEHKSKIWEKNKSRVLEYNKSTSKQWIIVDCKNIIQRIIGKEEFFKGLGLDPGCMSRMAKRLKNNKPTKRYDGYYCFFNEGQTDIEILQIVNKLDLLFDTEYLIKNKKTQETKILKKDEVYGFCIKEGYDYSSFLRMLKGTFKSYKNWVL